MQVNNWQLLPLHFPLFNLPIHSPLTIDYYSRFTPGFHHLNTSSSRFPYLDLTSPFWLEDESILVIYY
jgi:hypothetical protein